MKTEKWFEKKFDFNFGTEQFPILKEQLKKFPQILEEAISDIPDTLADFKANNKWSVKENTGHLLILEPLWLKRFTEMKKGAEKMSPADLNNAATHEADFNSQSIAPLLEKFIAEREKTCFFLDSLKPEELTNSSLHPRLLQPMRIIDLLYFVAEHDNHHLATIKEITNTFKI